MSTGILQPLLRYSERRGKERLKPQSFHQKEEETDHTRGIELAPRVVRCRQQEGSRRTDPRPTLPCPDPILYITYVDWDKLPLCA